MQGTIGFQDRRLPGLDYPGSAPYVGVRCKKGFFVKKVIKKDPIWIVHFFVRRLVFSAGVVFYYISKFVFDQNNKIYLPTYHLSNGATSSECAGQIISGSRCRQIEFRGKESAL